MTLIGIGAFVLIGILSGVLSVLAGGGVTVVLPVLLALGLTADQANATSRFNLTVGAVIATIVLTRKKNVDWNETLPLLVASVVGAVIGASAGTLIHSNAMLTIIVLTSVVSMILVYLKPNRWLSTAHSQAVVPDRVGALIYGFLSLYGGVVAVDSAILRLVVLVLLMGLPLSKANPIKVVTGLALFALSSAIYGDAGKVDWSVAAWLAAGTAIGSYVASAFAGSDGARKWVYLALQVSVTASRLAGLGANALNTLPDLRRVWRPLWAVGRNGKPVAIQHLLPKLAIDVRFDEVAESPGQCAVFERAILRARLRQIVFVDDFLEGVRLRAVGNAYQVEITLRRRAVNIGKSGDR
jgi:uncharacterized protein